MEGTLPERFIAPEPRGNGNGKSWEDAAALDDLSRMIGEAGPGGRVLLRAGAGAYAQRSLNIYAGGAPGDPVHIMGVDATGRPHAAEIVGTRTAPYDPNGQLGQEGFRLMRGADYLTFSHLSFVNQGNGCIRVAADISGLTIEDVSAMNVTRLIENNASGQSTATLTRFAFRRIVVRGFSRGVLRLRYDSRDGIIEDIVGDSEQQDKGNFAVGVSFYDNARDIRLRRCQMRNALDTTGKYWNGDGFSTERDNRAIRFLACAAFGNADAGFDCKGKVELIDCEASGNLRNYRVWGEAILVNCFSEDPVKRGGTGSASHVWLAKGATAVVQRFHHSAGSQVPVIDQRDGPSTVELVDTKL
jgi:hypothetical protein